MGEKAPNQTSLNELPFIKSYACILHIHIFFIVYKLGQNKEQNKESSSNVPAKSHWFLFSTVDVIMGGSLVIIAAVFSLLGFTSAG